MKLEKLINTMFDYIERLDGVNTSDPLLKDRIPPQVIEKFKEEILECEEFEDVTNLHIMNLPAIVETDTTGKQKPIIAKTMIVTGHNFKFEDTVYLYEFIKNPATFDPVELTKPVKDGIVISPLMYDPNDFSPKRKLTIEFTPEIPQVENAEAQRLINIGWYKQLHERIDKALENPMDYIPKSKRTVLVRGSFKCTSFDEKNKKDKQTK